MSVTFSQRLEKAIAESSLRQTEIAQRAGITPPYLSDLKTGKKLNPSKELLSNLAEILNVSLHWLMLGDESDSPTENHREHSSIQEHPTVYGNELWKTKFDSLIEHMDSQRLFDLVEEFQAQAFNGDEGAKALVAEIFPRLKERISKNPNQEEKTS